ncbi:hypothetical protein FKW77_010679 [Venturia effusa]|uniref:Serine aminopeptidase S33 domain-containing protein n=1 Tax=Venturia effusa TaxID=50376 RepID=A0A517KY55_9PEZI|nr:hypothetical protein FKW77_010679 [Venturia effusa]
MVVIFKEGWESGQRHALTNAPVTPPLEEHLSGDQHYIQNNSDGTSDTLHVCRGISETSEHLMTENQSDKYQQRLPSRVNKYLGKFQIGLVQLAEILQIEIFAMNIRILLVTTAMHSSYVLGSTLAPIKFDFPSLGETSAGDLYLPSGPGPFAITVTGPGFAGVKEMLIPDYANALAKAGYATLAFDYIGFGSSTGKVRQDIKPQDQIQTYRDSIDAVANDSRFDENRIGAWGTSLGGAHTLVVSANDPRVKAGVAIIPHIEIDAATMAERLPIVDAIEADVKASRTPGAPRVMIGVSGEPGERAALTSDGAVAWTKNVTRSAPTYKNEVTAMSMLAMAQYSTMEDAKRIKIPLLAITAETDSITPAKKIHQALDGVKSVEFRDFPGNHFGLFGANLTATIDLTVEWFQRHLQ